MSWRDCVQAIVAASGRSMTDDEVEAIATDVQRRAVAKMSKGMDARTAATEAGRELAGEATLAAMIEKRSAAINVLRKQEIMARRVEGQEIRTMRAILTGVEGSERDLGRSVDAQRHALRDAILGPMLVDLKKAKVWEALNSRDKAFERDVAREIWRLDDPEAPGTGNENARKAGEILHRYQEVSRAQQNEAGAWIGKLDHYITRQSHDMLKVRGDGSPEAFQKWAASILPKLDERTFAGMEPDLISRDLHREEVSSEAASTEANAERHLSAFREPAEGDAKTVSSSRGGGASILRTGKLSDALQTLRFDGLDGISGDLLPILRDKLAQSVGDVDVHVISAADMSRLEGDKAAAFYSQRHGYIVVRDADLGTMHSYRHYVMHEATHAATVNAIDEASRNLFSYGGIKTTLDAIMLDVERQLRGREGAVPNEYAFSNVKEFVAEAFSNKKFQEILSSVEVSKDLAKEFRLATARKTTVWQAVVDTIGKFLGIERGKYSALEAVIRVAEPHVEAAKGQKRGGGVGSVRAVERDADPRIDFLHNVWKAISSGIHDSSTSDALAGFKGPANLAKKASQERKLHFKDADAWFDYNEEFGTGKVIDGILHGIEKGARDTALMRTFGTNPEAMYRTIMDTWAKDARDRGDVALAADISKATWNDRILDTLTGKSSIPGNGTLHTIAATVRQVQQMSKLGGVVLSSVPDLVVNAAMLRHNGINLWEGLTKQIVGLLPKGEATREVAEAMGAGVDAMWGGIMHRFRAEDGALGKMARAVEIFHKVNGLTWWTDNLKQSAGLMLSNNLARRAEVAFEALPTRMQTTLRRYGIEAAEWDVARASNQVAADGRNYILPAHIEDAAVRDKFQTYITDQIREGMTEATAGTRTLATWGTSANSYGGEAVRMLMQFKTYTATFMQRSLGRELKRDGVDVGGMATMIAGLTALGYVSMTLKELAKGRNPRIPEDAQGWVNLVSAAAIQGGGLGLFGDFLFGENNRFGGGIVSSLAGPTMGNVEAVAKLISDMREGSHSRSRLQILGSDGLQLARDNAPFVNLFYTQAALNYLIIYRLQEALNPGYLRRYEANVKRQNNQTFWLHPSRAPDNGKVDVPSIFGGPR